MGMRLIKRRVRYSYAERILNDWAEWSQIEVLGFANISTVGRVMELGEGVMSKGLPHDPNYWTTEHTRYCQEIDKLVKQLPPDLKSAVEARHIDQVHYREAKEALHISLATYQSRLNIAYGWISGMRGHPLD